MASVTKHIVVRLEMTVPEARILRDTLVTFEESHLSDPIYRALGDALDSLSIDVESGD